MRKPRRDNSAAFKALEAPSVHINLSSTAHPDEVDFGERPSSHRWRRR
jgi:hypothetical protein